MENGQARAGENHCQGDELARDPLGLTFALRMPLPSLLIALRQNGPRERVDHVVRSTALASRVLQVVVHVPTIVFEHALDPIKGSIAVDALSVRLGDSERLVAAENGRC
jgi:hypothetical protein